MPRPLRCWPDDHRPEDQQQKLLPRTIALRQQIASRLLHYDMVSPEYMTSAIERARGGKKAGVKSGVTNVGFKENREETSGQDVVAT